MRLTLYQVDAFCDQVFSGNPAAVIPLDRWLPDDILQKIAAENNLSETAYFVAPNRSSQDHPEEDFHLRWFTPTNEVDLCGHATLASAWVLFHKLAFPKSTITFRSQAGLLRVTGNNDLLTMDFPARPATAIATPPALLAALGIDRAEATLLARDCLVVLPNEGAVEALKPDFNALAKLDYFAICATAPGNHCDFVSRFFAPRQGINEDPVTGSAHCTLAPYWQQQLGKNTLSAEQISARRGTLSCQVNDQRIAISGQARCYLQGEIFLPHSACEKNNESKTT